MTELPIRLEPDHPLYREAFGAYAANGSPANFNWRQYVWMPLNDNEVTVFIQVRGVSNLDEYYGGTTTLRK